MRSRLGIAVVLVVLGVVAGAFVATSASGKTTLHFVTGSTGQVAIRDAHRDGLRLGDRIAARGSLFDESRTNRVGSSYLQCLVHRRIVDPNQGLWNCNYVLELADGEIILQGLDPRGPGAYEMAVIGGTGSYAGATGDATFTDVGTSGDEYTDMVIRLNQ